MGSLAAPSAAGLRSGDIDAAVVAHVERHVDPLENCTSSSLPFQLLLVSKP